MNPCKRALIVGAGSFRVVTRPTKKQCYHPSVAITAQDHSTIKTERFLLQKEVWKAHVEVIHSNKSNEHSEVLLTLMPMAERGFGQDWARMVEVLAACVFPTDLVSLIYDGAEFLPTEVLTNECWAELTSRNKRKQLTGPQKFHSASTLATHDMVKMPLPLLQMIVLFWSRVFRDHQTSRTMPGTVVKLVHRSPLVQLGQVLRVLGLFLQPRCWGRIEMRFADTFA